MALVPLTQGKYAVIEDEDYELVSKFKWRLLRGTSGIEYAAHKNIFMHRLIMNAQKGQQLDHINRNGLDNRKENLRFATTTQNAQNQKAHRNTSSIFKGVCWHKNAYKWQCQIAPSGKFIYLGVYHNEIVAAWVYDQMAPRFFGKFAKTNF